MGKMVPYSGGMTEVRSDHNRILVMVIWWFLGVLGIHRFMVGKIWTGLLFLLTGGLFGVGWVWDGIQLALGRFTDAEGRVLGPPQQKALPATQRPVSPEKQLESDLDRMDDRGDPDVTKDEVERDLERDPLEDKFEELEKELGGKRE